MATFSRAKGSVSLTATGTPVSTNVDGNVTIGESVSYEIENCTTAYSFEVESTGAGDVADLDLSTLVVSQDTGTPTITDGEGKDFEGEDFSANKPRGLLIIADDGNTGNVTFELGSILKSTVGPGGFAFFNPRVNINTTTTTTLTLSDSGDKVRVVYMRGDF